MSVLCTAAALTPRSAHGNPPDPLLPLIHRIESYFHRNETDGITPDHRFLLNPSEVTRLSVVSQLLGYYDLHLARPNPVYKQAIASRADFLIDRFDLITTHTAHDGMLGYALLAAHELTNDPRYLDRAALIVARAQELNGWAATLNWGMMAAMCLAKFHDLTGDARALKKVKEIVASLQGLQNGDGSFPHYCPRTRDVHYTAWMGVELITVRRYVHDAVVDALLARLHEFLATRIGPGGDVSYSECSCASDEDGDGICDGYDLCPGTPEGCGVDEYGCEKDDNRDEECDPGPPVCLNFYSRGSGCVFDYDTRGWVNELGYAAVVFDYFRDRRYHDVMAVLYELADHGTLPDKWDYFAAPTDPVYPWASADTSVSRASAVFWALTSIYRSRSGAMPVRYRKEGIGRGSVRAVWGAGAGGVEGEGAAGRAGAWSVVDSLVIAGTDPREVCRHGSGSGWDGVPVDGGRGDVEGRRGPRGGPGAREDEAGNLGSARRSLAVAVRPNPAGMSGVTVAYEPAYDADVSAELVDLAGRRIRGWALGRVPGGRQELHWDCRDQEGRRVESGLYFLRIRLDGSATATGRIVVP